MGDREHIRDLVFLVSKEPIVPSMTLNVNGHLYVYSHHVYEEHYLVNYHYYYYYLVE